MQEEETDCLSQVPLKKSEKLFLTGTQESSDTALGKNVMYAHIQFNNWHRELDHNWITMTGLDHLEVNPGTWIVWPLSRPMSYGQTLEHNKRSAS